MNRFVRAGAVFRRNPLLGYGLAVVSFAAAVLLRFYLRNILPPGFPFLTFFPAVIVTAFLAGLRPGLVCAVLSGLASWYLFIPPQGTFGLDGASALALCFYIFIVTVDITLIQLMHRAVNELRGEKQVTEALYEQQRTMFQELQHRVANNMAFVSALLHLQKKKVAADPATAGSALDEAQSRIETMSRIHRRLYDPASVDLPVAQYFQEICSDLLQATGASNIVCMVDMPAIRLDIARLTTLSLLVTELVTNSLKHAFADAGGTITLKLERLDPGHVALTVSDNGRGLPEEESLATSKGLGTRIVQSLATQLGGEIKALPGSGTGAAWRVEFAA